ncbi:Short-chain dehydrogenase/reductase SDR [Caballeronia hypogeia]|uniref:Short-chain dehydrogenase/reductase SDR n=1 Tax=Caballeronia hypogeia TaxID=1777140 RepID=A0A158DMD5_9BURK|nr:SDR family oxidoreductase [Caballeronia hypogeia]SAK95772.1 Short-chain dehydrogenase/reductase SDR [Caballeronia hypogeia]
MNEIKPLALVFGGSRGIGAACVDALARSGADVAFTYASQSSAAREWEDKAGAHGAKVRGYRVDICDAKAVDDIFAQVQQDFGRAVRAVVANAGINVPPAPVAQFPDDAFRSLVEVNIVGAFNVLRAAAREVSDGGAIVALTTSLVRHAVPGVGPYSATKAAVECLVRSMSKELAARRVRVNAVAPGPVDTDLFRAGKTDEARARSASMSPLNRIGEPHEVAQVVAFLLSDKASWVDGQIVQTNGGMV